MQLSSGARTRQHEAISRFVDAGKRKRTDDGAVGIAASPGFVKGGSALREAMLSKCGFAAMF